MSAYLPYLFLGGFDVNILFIGDVVGSVGRSMLSRYADELIYKHKIDLFIVNGENAAHGKGINFDCCEEFFDAGADAITLGNHTFDNKDVFNAFSANKTLIRPANISDKCPGKGYCIIEKNNERAAVINLAGQVNCMNCNNPFEKADEIVTKLEKEGIKNIVVDFHAEATSEKIALGHFLDGRVSAVFGTHTHVQTADEKILRRKTAYITDAGMTGAYESVLGRSIEEIVNRFVTGLPQKFELADGRAQLNGVVLKTDASGRAVCVERINIIEK